MAIQRPGIRTPLPVSSSAGADTPIPLSDVEKQILDAKLAKTPEGARRLARDILKAIQKNPGKGSTDQQLKQAIKELQKESGLPQTGKIDAKTKEVLQERGILPKADQKTEAKGDAKKADGAKPATKTQTPVDARSPRQTTPKPSLANFSGTAKPQLGTGGPARGIPGQKLEQKEAAQRAELAGPPKNFDLSSVLNGLAKLGFFGAGAGKERLKEAVASFQAASGLPESGTLDPKTQAALETAGVHESADSNNTGGAAQEAHGDNAKAAADNSGRSAHGPTSDSSSAADAVDNPFARADAQTAGLTDRQETAAEKALRKKKGKGGRGGDGEDGDGEGDEGDGASDGAEAPGESNRSENASSGDDNLDDIDRGHATLKKDEAERGHYEVALLSVQVQEALDAIQRVETASGATAYAWDVTFYRPGVYGAGQTAEPLWHIAVDEASAFDPVWAKARDVLGDRLGKAEPEFELTDDMFTLALRRARVRD